MIPFIRKLKQCYFSCVINDFETASINHDIKLLKYDMNSYIHIIIISSPTQSFNEFILFLNCPL